MDIFGSVTGLFQRKRTLDSVTIDELRREKIRLEQEEGKLARQVEALEQQKQQLFLKGKDEPSERQRRILATKIKELDIEAANKDKTLQIISKYLRTTNGFIQIKEHKTVLDGLGLSSLINSMDLTTLQEYVVKASVEGQFQIDKLASILGTVEDSDRTVRGSLSEDKDILEIMKAMQETKLAEMERPEAAESFARQKLDTILHKEKADTEL